MGRPKGPPTTVVRLPAELVARIDGLRGEVSRADYLDALVVRDDIDGPVSRKGLGAKDGGSGARAPRGSRSPSLERFK